MSFKRLTVWVTLAAFLVGQQPARAQSHEDGVAAGAAANAAIRGMVNEASARSVVPGYTTTPPETAYAGQPSLAAQARAKQVACQTMPNDPSCQGLQTATTSANTPRPVIGAGDPAVMEASRIARNPSVQLGSLSAYYSGCSTADVTTSATTQTRSCQRYQGVGAFSCSKSLTVGITRTANCTPGDWTAHAQSGTTGIDAQCLPDLPDSRQHFRITESGRPVRFFDVDMSVAGSFPQKVTDSVYVGDKSCTGDRCSLTALIAPEETRLVCWGSTEYPECKTVSAFRQIRSACPAGAIGGDLLMNMAEGESSDPAYSPWTAPGPDPMVCFRPSETSTGILALRRDGYYQSPYWLAHSTRTVVGWDIDPEYGPIPRMQLNYTKAKTTVTETDQWADHCPTLDAGSRCSADGAPQCTAGPATRNIDGASVTRSCWEYQSTMSCQAASANDQCGPLVAAGCTPVSSACARMDPVTGACEVIDDKYACSVPSQTVTTASNCTGNKFCLGTSCFDITQTNDPDFARSMSYLEAGREAGVYLDPDRMEVFAGEQNQCGDRLLKNCCYSDSAGKGMSNQSAFGGVASRLVFDLLMKESNRQFVMHGLQALVMSGGFSGTYTTYGVTVAINGAALPAGSTVLYASGNGLVIAFDPWSLAIAVVIMIVMSMMSCNEEEGKLAMKEGAGLCHEVGSFCSSRFLGSCTEQKHTKCCFNSVLARIINEQGRLQVGKGWGSAQNADCSGFTIAQLQTLDFAAMDLSEFYASIVPATPDVNLIQTKNAATASGCYYGNGKC